MRREEKLAQKVLKKYGLVPPYDIMDLVNKKAIIAFHTFPFQADGITVDIKSHKPRIYINDALGISKTRQKFTIAHELGHIFLPWHKGTIASDINEYNFSAHSMYKDMEAEANRFASELLMPTNWIVNILDQNIPFEARLERILQDAGVSLEAALIKIDNTCNQRRTIAVFSNDLCVKEITGLKARKFHYLCLLSILIFPLNVSTVNPPSATNKTSTTMLNASSLEGITVLINWLKKRTKI